LIRLLQAVLALLLFLPGSTAAQDMSTAGRATGDSVAAERRRFVEQLTERIAGRPG
jgi:hypothetical protein